MASTQTGLEKFADRFIPAGLPLSEIKTERLWVLNTAGMGFFGVFLTCVELSIGTPMVTMLCASLFFGALISLWLTHRGNSKAAKLIAHFQVIAVIMAINAIYSERVFAWAFLIPVVISASVVFKPADRIYVIIIHLLSFVCLPIYLFFIPPRW